VVGRLVEDQAVDADRPRGPLLDDTVLGGVVVAPNASELVLPVSLAVQHGLTVDQVAHTFSIYPSLSESLTEAARQLMLHG
jgi:dihydrolipoamide dehydrogenase